MNGPIAFYRRLYGPCLVYTATMIFSIFYHACDQESFSGSLPSGLQLTCLSLYVNNEVLQFCDFFSAILSFWVTVSFYFLNMFQQDWDSIPNCEQFILCLVLDIENGPWSPAEIWTSVAFHTFLSLHALKNRKV